MKYATVTDGAWQERGDHLYEGDDLQAAAKAAHDWQGTCTIWHFTYEGFVEPVMHYQAGRATVGYVKG